MRFSFIAFLIFTFVLPAYAIAQESPLRNTVPKIKDDQALAMQARTKEDFSNLYYNQCQRNYYLPGYEKHTKLLCACTSAKMFALYSLPEAKSVFQDTEDGAFQRDRLALNGFIPCLEKPVADIVFDRCFQKTLDSAQNYTEKQASKEIQACKCLGKAMGEHVLDSNNALRSWGIRRAASFSANMIPQDALLKIINEGFFQSEMLGKETLCRRQN